MPACIKMQTTYNGYNFVCISYWECSCKTNIQDLTVCLGNKLFYFKYARLKLYSECKINLLGQTY